MFIIDPIKKEDATGKLKTLLMMVEKKLGFIPPHFELFASIDLEGMQAFLKENLALMNHERIDRNLLPYLRLEIANKECRNYCTVFNTNMLERMQHPELDAKQKALMAAVLKAIYDSKTFGAKDIAALEALGFEHKDFFLLLEYATGFMGKSKIIEAYLK
jgi:hypothetical protein